jgi:hypothetical protein
VLGYLNNFKNHRIALNSSKFDLSPLLPNSSGECVSWGEFIQMLKRRFPLMVLQYFPIQITIFVDADHAHCEVTHRSVTDIIVFINSTPVKWYPKMQHTVETSTYGSA